MKYREDCGKSFVAVEQLITKNRCVATNTAKLMTQTLVRINGNVGKSTSCTIRTTTGSFVRCSLLLRKLGRKAIALVTASVSKDTHRKDGSAR